MPRRRKEAVADVPAASNGAREVRIVNMRRVVEENPVRQGLFARLALLGPTGSGKTHTALSLATELQGDLRTLGIDTERQSMKLFAHDPPCNRLTCRDPDHFDFAHMAWDPPYGPAELATVVTEEARSGKYGVIIIDSLTHFWAGEGGTLDVVDASKSRSGGNEFTAWKFGSKAQDEMVEAILTAPCHVIVCMRVGMHYDVEKNEHGKLIPVKVGVQPKQRSGLEYEFTVIGDLNLNHELTISKSRCSPIADKVYPPHHEREMARAINNWLNTAEAQSEARLKVTRQEADDRIIDALHEADAKRRIEMLVDVGYKTEVKVPIGEWVRAASDETAVRLIGALRLPLRLTGEPTPPLSKGAETPERIEDSAPDPAASEDQSHEVSDDNGNPDASLSLDDLMEQGAK